MLNLGLSDLVAVAVLALVVAGIALTISRWRAK
jgi:hypothetical protein